MKPEWRNEQAQVIAMALAGQVHDNDDAQCVETLAARLINTALLDAHQRGRREGVEWQPIETAPKDGVEIIGYRPDQGVFVFRWAWMAEFVPTDMNGDPTEEYDDTFSWWWHDLWGWMEGDETPTHWMPLPEPPAAIQAKAQEVKT